MTTHEETILIDRAIRAGWTWHERLTTWPGCKEYPATGWRHDAGTFSNCNVHDKASRLRPEPGRGFDHDLECVECGKPIWLQWSDETEMRACRECFDCNFWMRLLRRRDDKSVVIDRDGKRTHYRIGTAKGPTPYNGFGGSKFVIRFLADGREVTTFDLWHQGEIPERFHDRFAVNAEFVRTA